tara:strand:- start:73 stop:714 length:642 start_codon:yes stop_codon:yes gene_type:complete
MSFTYTTLKQAIQDYVESSETSFVSNLPTFIQQAEDRILKRVQLPDFRKNVTGTVASANPYLIMPSDFLTPYSMAIDDSGYDYLLFKDVNFIRQAYPSSATQAAPKYYGIFSDTSFIVGPTPDKAYDVELHYFHKPESITTSSTGTSWLGDNADSTLLYGCLLEAYTYLKGDPDLMQLYGGRYEEALVRLEELGEGYSTTDSYRGGAVRKPRT